MFSFLLFVVSKSYYAPLIITKWLQVHCRVHACGPADARPRPVVHVHAARQHTNIIQYCHIPICYQQLSYSIYYQHYSTTVTFQYTTNNHIPCYTIQYTVVSIAFIVYCVLYNVLQFTIAYYTILIMLDLHAARPLA